METYKKKLIGIYLDNNQTAYVIEQKEKLTHRSLSGESYSWGLPTYYNSSGYLNAIKGKLNHFEEIATGREIELVSNSD